MTRARFLPEAEDEFAEAVQFYERAEIGLGAAFTLEVERVVDRICAFPESGAKFSSHDHRDRPSTPQARLLAEKEGCAPLTTRWSGP